MKQSVMKTAAQKQAAKIFWRQSETDAVVNKAYELLNKGEVSGLCNAAKEAQEFLLAPSRQRPLTSLMSAVTGFKKRYEELQKQKKLQDEKKDEDAKKEENVRARMHETTIPQFVNQLKVEPEKPSEIEVVQDNQPMNVLHDSEFIGRAIMQIADNFKDALLVELKAKIAEAFSEIQVNTRNQINSFKVAPVKHLPRVVVCGVRPGQSGRLRSDFGNLLKLSIIEERQSAIRLKNTAENADYVVLNTEYCGHDYLDQVKSHDGLIRITGGNESFERALKDIINRS